MHTAETLTAGDFEYRRDGRPVERSEVMPAVSLAERVGVVMGAGTDGLGAGNFLLSCVTAFYDRLRARREEFFEYPDYYTFQATDDPVDYRWFDVWPDHKHVAVPPTPEAVLRAVNNRAIDVLLVPDGPRRDPYVDDVTRRSAERRLDGGYLYSPDGRPADADFSIRLPRRLAGEWYERTAESAAGPAAPAEADPAWADGETIEQSFRRVSLDRALSCLPAARSV